MAEGNEVVPKKEALYLDDNTIDVSAVNSNVNGLDLKVISKLNEIYQAGKLSQAELDGRALDALKECPVEEAIFVLTHILEANLDYVSNKSAYLCGVMKTYRQKSRGSGITRPGSVGNASNPVKGPDEDKLRAILERTGYKLDVTTGQRKYGGPPPNWNGPPPGPGCEVYCGNLPRDIYEDELVILFEQRGRIWDLRLMMDPIARTNRGFAFITFATKEEAQHATKDLNNYEIKPGKHLKVNVGIPNRIFIGNIPKSKDKEEIFEEFAKITVGLTNVITYSSPDDNFKNRGFCFLEYESHKAAFIAKQKFETIHGKVWGCDILADWADPQEEPDFATMSKVKVLYVKSITQECSEEKLKEVFQVYGKVYRVKKIKDYAFIHYEERDHAVNAMNELNGKDIGGSYVEVSLAKPPSNKKKREEIIRARERRMVQLMQVRYRGFSPQNPIMPRKGPIPRGSSSTMRFMGRGDCDYDCCGYRDYRGGYNDLHPKSEKCNFRPALPPILGRAARPVHPRGCETHRCGVWSKGRGMGAWRFNCSSNSRVHRQFQRAQQTQGSPHRGHPSNYQPALGSPYAEESLPAKRKVDEDKQKEESKRRFENNWINELPPQPLGNTCGSGYTTVDQKWYLDSYSILS